MIRGKWWEVFNEPELNDLEEQLVVNNQNIKASFENFMAARALVAQARAQYWPTVNVGAGMEPLKKLSQSSQFTHSQHRAKRPPSGPLPRRIVDARPVGPDPQPGAFAGIRRPDQRCRSGTRKSLPSR